MDSKIHSNITADEWRRAMGAFPSGVTIVACLDAQGQPWGMTVASFCSLSMEPPLLLACMDQQAPTLPHVIETGYFSVNILRAGQGDLSDHFAIAPDEERFPTVAYHPGVSGSPLLDDALVAIDCELENRMVAGDHSIFVGKPLEIYHGSHDSPPLVYWRSKYRDISSDP